MKNIYIIPELQVVEIKITHQLLAGSEVSVSSTSITDDEVVLSRRGFFDDDEEEY